MREEEIIDNAEKLTYEVIVQDDLYNWDNMSPFEKATIMKGLLDLYNKEKALAENHRIAFEKQTENLHEMECLYNKEKAKNDELRNLFNIQKSIARSLNFGDKEKMIQWNNKYYVPYTMEIREDIDKPSRIILIYVDISNLLEEDNK